MDGTLPVTAHARTRILDAAETLVRAKGVGDLMLGVAAKLAGVFKGGLLDHFGCKEALLTGLPGRMADAASGRAWTRATA